MAACMVTWNFLQAVESSSKSLLLGDDYITALERGINVVELDNSVKSVGLSGIPNSHGELQLDAAIMKGDMLQFGGVAAMKRIDRPISVARKVLECSHHSLIVGEGATQFAVEKGFKLQPLITEKQVPVDSSSPCHDTVCMIILDRHGNIAVGSSTSGSPNKHVGRVGDSPLPGCGLYADNQIGAAAATGNGDEIMRFCCTFQIVQYMKQGLDVQSACQQMVTNISERIGVNNIFEVGFIAMDKQGNCGAAGTVKSWSDNATEYPGFPYVVWNEKTMPVPSIKVEPAVICSAT